MTVYSLSYNLDFKFNSAHFIIHDDCREALHGHNYKLSLEIYSSNLDPLTQKIINNDSFHYNATSICNDLKHKLLLASKNTNCILQEIDDEYISLSTNCDGKTFKFPKSDIKLLDITDVSSEMLAKYISIKLIECKDQYVYNTVNYIRLVVKLYEDEGKYASYINSI